jgi:hypothetical protein
MPAPTPSSIWTPISQSQRRVGELERHHAQPDDH